MIDHALPSSLDSEAQTSQVRAATLGFLDVDTWRACARVLNRVPAHLTQLPDGSVFFMVNLPEDTCVDEVVDALEPVTVEDEDDEACVVHTDLDEEDYAVLARDAYGSGKRFMLVELRGSYTDSTGGLAEVTVLPEGTEKAHAIARLKALAFPRAEDAYEPDEQAAAVPAERPAAIREPSAGAVREPSRPVGLGGLLVGLLTVGCALGALALGYWR